MSDKIFFATTNENKLREAREILGTGIEGIKIGVDEIQTLNPEKCAVKKAAEIYKQCQKPILVEDTALLFEAWKGLPGVFIDYFMKTVGNEGLLKMLEEEENRGAVAQTTLVLCRGENDYQIFTGVLEGTVADKPRGEHGFGWDPIFIPNGFDKTLAEMSTKEKNDISTRRKALEQLRRAVLFS